MSMPAANRLHILQAVEDGQISAREADRLLGALGQAAGPAEAMVRVQVVETATDRLRVDLALPLSVWAAFATLGLHPDSLWGLPGTIDAGEVVARVDQGATGLLAEATDEARGLRVSLSLDGT